MISRFPQDLSMLIDSQVQKYTLGTTILVAGVDDSGTHLYCIEDPGSMSCFDRLGYHAIGSGHRHSLLKLVALGQHQSTTINETVFNVFCAKRVAELAPGVGQATSMKIVSRGETRSVEQTTLDGLAPAYDRQAEPISDDIKEAIAGLPYGNGGDHDSAQETRDGNSGARA